MQPNIATNAQMRRIDLICKLIGPLAIALVDGVSTKFAILFNLGMNICSVVVEYFSIARVSLTTRLEFIDRRSILLTHTLRYTMKYPSCKSERRKQTTIRQAESPTNKVSWRASRTIGIV